MDEERNNNFEYETQDEFTSDNSSQRRFPVLQQLLLLGLVLGLIFGGSYIPQVIGKNADQDTVVGKRPEPLPPVTAQEPRELENIEVAARAAYVWDVRNQRVLYSKEADEALPLASITKLMTTLVAYELVSETENVNVNEAAIRQEGDSGLLLNETFSLKTLSDFALVTSSNDAAFALAGAAGTLLSEQNPAEAFVAGMNIRAEELGLSNTSFENPTGLDMSPFKPGAVGSARDVTALMEYILLHHPELLEPTQRSNDLVYNEAGGYHEAANTNALVSEIPNLLGSKTGYTDLAGGNLVVVFDAGLNRPIIVTVLGSSRYGRFTDVMTLVDAILSAEAQIET